MSNVYVDYVSIIEKYNILTLKKKKRHKQYFSNESRNMIRERRMSQNDEQDLKKK